MVRFHCTTNASTRVAFSADAPKATGHAHISQHKWRKTYENHTSRNVRQMSTFNTNDRLHIPMVRWPNRCPCFGSSIDGHIKFKLTHFPALGVSSAGHSESANSSWRNPICGRCQFHFKSTVAIKWALMLLPPLLWFGTAWLLFLAGLEENWFAIALWIVEGVVLVGIAYLDWRSLNGIVRVLLRRRSCWGVEFSMRASSRYSVLEFEIDNDGYADDFAALNT